MFLSSVCAEVAARLLSQDTNQKVMHKMFSSGTKLSSVWTTCVGLEVWLRFGHASLRKMNEPSRFGI